MAVQVNRVCCQGCGANLEIDGSIRFVTCNFCGARLEIVHDETTTHSRLLQEIGEKTDRMAGDLRIIRLQNDLEQLDREWESERLHYMVKGKDGSHSEPSSAGSVIGGVVMVVFGIFWTGIAASMGAPGPFPLFGLLFIGFAIFMMISNAGKAQQYSAAADTMRRRREELLADLEKARNGS